MKRTLGFDAWVVVGGLDVDAELHPAAVTTTTIAIATALENDVRPPDLAGR